MIRLATSLLLVLCLASGAFASDVWVGAGTSPGEIADAKRLLNSIDDLGTDPTNQELGAALADLFIEGIDGATNPDHPAFVFDSTSIPANLCSAAQCDVVGKALCEKKPGVSSKGSTIFFDHCITLCAVVPVRENDPLFWTAIQCP